MTKRLGIGMVGSGFNAKFHLLGFQGVRDADVLGVLGVLLIRAPHAEHVGFNAKFHLLGFQGVRDADVLGVWSPNQKNAGDTATIARALGVGDAKAYPSIAAMVEDPAMEAIWLSGPN